MLGTERNGVQLATLLSRKYLTVQQLCDLSGKDIQRCREFVQRLDALELLKWDGADAAGLVVSNKVIPVVDTPTAFRGLLFGIRKRLGLV